MCTLHLEVRVERQGDDVEDGRHDVNEVDAALPRRHVVHEAKVSHAEAQPAEAHADEVSP